jgi:hypothetical protein
VGIAVKKITSRVGSNRPLGSPRSSFALAGPPLEPDACPALQLVIVERLAVMAAWQAVRWSSAKSVPREAHLVLFGCGPKGDLFGLQKRPGLPVCGSEIPSLFSCPKDCD